MLGRNPEEQAGFVNAPVYRGSTIVYGSLDDLEHSDELHEYLEQCANSDTDPLALLERSAFRKALGSERIRKTFADQGLEPASDLSPAGLSTFIAQEVTKWKAVVDASGAKLD